jgi:hypothetical protein
VHPYAHACALTYGSPYACLPMPMLLSPPWPTTMPPYFKGDNGFLSSILIKLSYFIHDMLPSEFHACHMPIVPPPLPTFCNWSTSPFHICVFFLLSHNKVLNIFGFMHEFWTIPTTNIMTYARLQKCS